MTILPNSPVRGTSIRRSYMNIQPSKAIATVVVSALQKCRSLRDLNHVHATMIKCSADQDPFHMNQFIAACSRLRQADYAHTAFAEMKEPNAFVYNATIHALVQHSEPIHGIKLYVQMLRANVVPSGYTFSCLVEACRRASAPCSGRTVHAQAFKLGYGAELVVQTALIDFYSHWGEIKESRRIFDEMPQRDVISWTVMMQGYIRLGDLASARNIFDVMPERSIVSWNAMVAGYARLGDMDTAAFLFRQMPGRNLVSWTTMISCYSHNKQYKEALLSFEQMKAAGIGADEVTVVAVISACAHLGALDVGKELHMYAAVNGFDINVYIGSALIDMYAKCGDIERALLVFYKLENKNIFCWNSMIQGLAIHGFGEKAINAFNWMSKEGKVTPNCITFLSVLSACNHSGLVEEGRMAFLSMQNDYTLSPEMEHYGCMVDLLGRAGRIQEVFNLIQGMHMEPSAAIWAALLSACKIYGHLEAAEYAAEKLLALEPSCSAAYMLLVNMYAQAKTWDKVEIAREMMKAKGVQKKVPACSWYEIDGVIHEFAACDMLQPSQDIFLLVHELDGLLKLEENSPYWTQL